MSNIYEAVIGLEVHVELSTKTKMFCSCQNTFLAPPNSCVCPICMGLPGSLPVLNERAVALAVRAGLATGCKIASVTRFDRKNYFYPDLPKSYQISQYEHPICIGGRICIGDRSINITRIHMEEDAGKLVHDKSDGTLIDCNRCGIPLIEIVSEPEIHSADEARAYLQELRTRLLYAGVSDCRADKSSFRCDVNISVRQKGQTALGVRTEIKNINSIAFVGKAIDYEFARQCDVLEHGGKVLPETRRFDESSGRTVTMRVKETAADYRFFPEPDLLPFRISREYVLAQESTMPEMPNVKRGRYTNAFGLTADEAQIIAARPELASFYDRAVSLCSCPKICANILLTHLLGMIGADSFDCPLSPSQLAEISELFATEAINSSTVKRLVSMCTDTDDSPTELVNRHGLAQINDKDELYSMLMSVLSDNPRLLSDYRSGKLAAEKAIIGKAMAMSAGKANPKILNEIWSKIK